LYSSVNLTNLTPILSSNSLKVFPIRNRNHQFIIPLHNLMLLCQLLPLRLCLKAISLKLPPQFPTSLCQKNPYRPTSLTLSNPYPLSFQNRTSLSNSSSPFKPKFLCFSLLLSTSDSRYAT
jgi:hypothetical protein